MMINALLPTAFVWVVNQTEQTHTDKYAGVVISFAPNDAVLLPADIATVMLGYGEKDKTRCLLRLGLMQPGDVRASEQAQAWLRQFFIEEAVYEPPTIFRQREGGTRADPALSGAGKSTPKTVTKS